MDINLFYNYYKDDNRQHEIDECLRKNMEVFSDVIIVEGRPTFSELFSLTKNFPNSINCFCNSDVYFESTSLLKKIGANDCFAITRNDLRNNPRISHQSQDAWCFYGVVSVKMPFCQGMWGVDNRLVYELRKSGYNVINPCHQINIIHLHKVDNRNQQRTLSNTIEPPYDFVKPSNI